MQFPARIPITVALIGTCAITRNFVPPQPNRGHAEDRIRGATGTGWDPDPLPSLPPLRLGGSGKRRRGRAAVEPCCPNSACSPVTAFASRLSSRRASTARGWLPRSYRCSSGMRSWASRSTTGQGRDAPCLSDRTPHQGLRGTPGTAPCFDARGNPMCNLPPEFQ